MADRLMYIPNDETQNYPFCRLQLVVALNEPTNQNSMKVLKVVKPTNKKIYYKALRTSVINSPFSPPYMNMTPTILKSIYFKVIMNPWKTVCT